MVPPYIGPPRPPRNQSQSPDHWSPPPQWIFNLNFDGAAKGNPGPAGIGVAIRNSEGIILGVFWGAIRETANNMAEIKALMTGLDMVRTSGWQPTIVEGDSLIIIQMANKILNGKHVHKVADNWRLIHSLENLWNKLYNHLDVKLLHVRRKANALADLLANHGVEKGQEIERTT